MRKIISIFLLSILSVLPFVANAKDVTGFSVRGVSPGMNATKACSSLADDFPDDWGLKEKVGIARNSHDWLFDVDGSIRKDRDYSGGCGAGFEGYDKTFGSAMTWADNISVSAENGIAYHAKNTQSLAVGDSIEDCQNRRQQMIDGLVEKYGKPTFLHDKGRNKNTDFRHLIWDYSSSNSARVDDTEYEIYEVNIQCEMYDHKVRFAKMIIQSEVHSGKVIQEARNKVKIKQTFEPSL